MSKKHSRRSWLLRLALIGARARAETSNFISKNLLNRSIGWPRLVAHPVQPPSTAEIDEIPHAYVRSALSNLDTSDLDAP